MRNYEDVCCGIVTFNPDVERLAENLEAVVPQVSEVFIYDNGSENVEEIKALVQGISCIHLIESMKNDGMSVALNRLCERAIRSESEKAHQYEYLLALDQDSVSHPDMVSNLLKHATKENGIVAPVSVNRNIPISTYETNRENLQFVSRVNTSGSLINLNAYVDVGGYNEHLFVDWVDIEFCLRLRESGYKIGVSSDAFLLHDLGQSEFLFKIPWLSGRRIVMRSLFRTNHALRRHQDCARSWAIMLHEHRDSPLIKGEKANILLGIIQRMVTESKKAEILKSLYKGYRNGKSFLKENQEECRETI